MMLAELSEGYRQSALLLRRRLRILRKRLAVSCSAEERASLRHEVAMLTPILTQCRDLAELTAHYYERSFYRDEKYTL